MGGGGVMNRSILLAIIAGVVLFSLGCITTNQEIKHENATVTTLRIGYQPNTHHVAEMVAVDKGWMLADLKPLGVTGIKEFGFPSANPELMAMKAGDLDVAYLCTSPFVTAAANGLDAKIVAGVNINGSNLVLRPDLVYQGPQSLVGLHIGTLPPGTAQDVILKEWLLKNNVNLSKINITAMGPGDAVKAMLTGKVDGVFLPQPAPAMIEIAGKGKSVLTSGEIWPNHACCGIIVSGKLIRDNPELVDQIVKAHINATNYINAHPDEAARIYSNRTGQDLAMAQYSIKTWDGRWTSDPYQLINDTLEFANFQYNLKYVQRRMTAKDLFDLSFYDKVK
jgi:NitT/TauT family transport system substrate-binding protein